MKKLIFSNRTYYIAISLMAIILTSFAWNRDKVNKRIEKSFPITADDIVHIENKYGKIVVENWSKNEVSFDILVEVEGGSESKAKDKLDNIKVEFAQSGDKISAVTVIDDGWSWWSWGGKTKYNINYLVKLPAANNLELEMDYGNITLADRTAPLTSINLDYGNVKGGTVTGELHLDMDYSNAHFHKASRLKVNMDYSDFQIMEANDAIVRMDYSDVNIERSERLDLKGDYSDAHLGIIDKFAFAGDYTDIVADQLGDTEIRADYTDVEIDRLCGRIESRSDYGSLIIGEIGPGFRGGKIASDYYNVTIKRTTIDLGVDIDAKYTGINIPSSWTHTHQVKDGVQRELKSHKGKASAPLFSCNMTYGSFSIKE